MQDFYNKSKKVEKIDDCLFFNKGRKIPSNKTIKDLEKLQLKKILLIVIVT